MNPEILNSWLKKKKTWGVTSNCLFGVLAFIAGLVVLFLTFWFTYAAIYFIGDGFSSLCKTALNKQIHVSHTTRLICSGLFILLLFIQHFRTSPFHWGEYPKREYCSAFVSHRLGPMALLLYPGASANMIADILLSGPRLVTGAWTLVSQALRLRRMDEAGCAQLLVFLASKPGAVPYEDLRSAGWEDWFPHLRCIEGVLFLERGLSLSSDLRKELSTAIAGES